MTAPSDFRWQGLFQHSGDALFVLNRRRRILFVNRAWEALADLPLAEARGLACRRARPASPADSPTEVLSHALCPPPEVLRGQSARARRLLPSRAGARWWDVEFLPFFKDGTLLGVVGRVLPVPTEAAAVNPALPEKLVALRERVARRCADEQFEGANPAVRRLNAGIRLAAGVAAPVLIVGEPGAGKETVARLIHFRSPFRERPFAALDATRLPPAALAPVLFGADVATVYVKEPGRLPREMQARLAELLAEGSEDRPLPRILAGCATDPVAEVRAGRLLDDLHAALAPLTITVPPLRERGDELPRLVERLLERVNEDEVSTVRGLTPDAWEAVRAYSWPGNVRELLAALSVARAQAKENRVSAADLPASVRLALRLDQTPGRPPDKPLPLETLLEEAERRLIRLALQRAGGNRARAADLLGLMRQRLQRRMEALGLDEA